MTLDFQDVRPLAVGLPKLAVLSDIRMPAVERVVAGLLAAGLDVTLFCLKKGVHHYAEYVDSLEKHIIEVASDGKNMFNTYLAMQKIKLLRYQFKNIREFEGTFIDVELGVDLRAYPQFTDAGLVLVCSARGLVNWHKARTTFAGKKVLWRLSACWGYTACCNITGGCERWKLGGCSNCPQSESSTAKLDLARDLFAAKCQLYPEVISAVVTPSSWLGKQVRESILLKGFPQFTIPTSVTIERFAPTPRSDARAQLALPQDRKVILFGAGTFRPNKGFALLCSALDTMRRRWEGALPVLAFFGKNAPQEMLPEGYQCVDLGYLDTVEKLSTAYNAADVFVSPSFQDNLPNTVNEALACGTPVVCFDKFSSEDVVLNGVTGYTARHPGLPLTPDGRQMQYPPYTAPPEDLDDLAACIHRVLSLPRTEYEAMRQRCRAKALEWFSPRREAMSYLDVFRQVLGLPEVELPESPDPFMLHQSR